MRTIFICLSLLISFYVQAENLDSIYQILKEVESNNNPKAIGDGGKAYGILQIHKICVDDVNRIYKTNYTHEQMFDESCAQEVFNLYLKHGIKRYKSRYCCNPTTEQIVRMWNGGIYTGYKKESTEKYYKRYLKFEKMETQKIVGGTFKMPQEWLINLEAQRQQMLIHQKAQGMEIKTIKEVLKNHLGREAVLEDGLLCHKSYYTMTPNKFILMYKNESLGTIETRISKNEIICIFKPTK